MCSDLTAEAGEQHEGAFTERRNADDPMKFLWRCSLTARLGFHPLVTYTEDEHGSAVSTRGYLDLAS